MLESCKYQQDLYWLACWQTEKSFFFFLLQPMIFFVRELYDWHSRAKHDFDVDLRQIFFFFFLTRLLGEVMLNSFSVTTPRSLCYQGSLVSADLLLCCEQTGTVVPFAVSRPEPVNLKSHISELCDIYVRRTRLLSVSVNQLAHDKSSPTRPEWRSYDALYGSCLLRYFITTLIQKCAFNPEMSVTLSLFQVICDMW